MWIFWPSFNSALLELADERNMAVFNTYYALAVSTVTGILMSALAHPQGKINMVRRRADHWATLGSSRPYSFIGFYFGGHLLVFFVNIGLRVLHNS